MVLPKRVILYTNMICKFSHVLQSSWTPLHADVLRSFSWSVNVAGAKRWLLLPPRHTHLLYDRFGRCMAPSFSLAPGSGTYIYPQQCRCQSLVCCPCCLAVERHQFAKPDRVQHSAHMASVYPALHCLIVPATAAVCALMQRSSTPIWRRRGAMFLKWYRALVM